VHASLHDISTYNELSFYRCFRWRDRRSSRIVYSAARRAPEGHCRRFVKICVKCSLCWLFSFSGLRQMRPFLLSDMSFVSSLIRLKTNGGKHFGLKISAYVCRALILLLLLRVLIHLISVVVYRCNSVLLHGGFAGDDRPE